MQSAGNESFLLRWIRRTTTVENNEVQAASLSFVFGFILMASYFVLRVPRDAMASDWTDQEVSILWTINFFAVTVFGCVVWFRRRENRISGKSFPTSICSLLPVSFCSLWLCSQLRMWIWSTKASISGSAFFLCSIFPCSGARCPTRTTRNRRVGYLQLLRVVSVWERSLVL